MALLRIHEGGAVRVRELDGTTVTLGRTNANSIVVNDSAASSRHAQVVHDEAGWRIEDRGSLNGTFVNGLRTQTAPLTHGDRIQIGATEIAFEDLHRSRGRFRACHLDFGFVHGRLAEFRGSCRRGNGIVVDR